MTFAVSLGADAQRDFYRAQAYYDAEAPHETERFVGEFFATARRLTDFPYSSPELRRGARCVGSGHRKPMSRVIGN